MSNKSKDEKTETSILIVDDVPINLQVLVNILREKSYKISVATSGEKALEMVERFLPDLILLDVMMPEMDGFEVCQKLKEDEKTRDIPVIFLTAKTEKEDIIKGFGLGAVDYVTKPFNKAELLARVDTHLLLRRSQKEIIYLEQKNAVLAMAITVNHEINQPLTALKGYFELFQRQMPAEDLTEKQRNFLAKMNKSIDEIESILEKFSGFGTLQFEEYLGDKKMAVLK